MDDPFSKVAFFSSIGGLVKSHNRGGGVGSMIPSLVAAQWLELCMCMTRAKSKCQKTQSTDMQLGWSGLQAFQARGQQGPHRQGYPKVAHMSHKGVPKWGGASVGRQR